MLNKIPLVFYLIFVQRERVSTISCKGKGFQLQKEGTNKAKLSQNQEACKIAFHVAMKWRLHMNYELGLTTEPGNTQYAPLGALLAYYKQNGAMESLNQVAIPMKAYEFTGQDKLKQVFISILAGCETLSEVNQKLKTEAELATIYDWPRFADQSGLSRALDALTLMNIEELRQSGQEIGRTYGQTRKHDWRGHLWLDFDLSGLPCGERAEKSQKGYFSGKKTSQDAN